MKFEEIKLQSVIGTTLQEKEVVVEKKAELSTCTHCQAFTRWAAPEYYVCSQECLAAKLEGQEPIPSSYFDKNRALLIQETKWRDEAVNSSKDIIIVVHNQLEYIKECIASVRANTTNYRLFIWDNASDEPVRTYLERLMVDGDCELMRSNENLGFITPNNELVNWGTGEYIILLNSDTKVQPSWTQAMLGFLQQNPEFAAVGYCGGLLDEEGKGGNNTVGYDIDFINGWALCFTRQTYREFGLFSDQLRFAYCEDADFCLRLKEAGKKIYALATPLVFHHGNQTIKQVVAQKKIDVRTTFDQNHEYMRLRWGEYLKNQRVQVLSAQK